MQYQTLTSTAYADLVVRLISAFEGHEIVARNIGDAKATIGYGYTFNRTDNVALWTAAGIALTSAELAALAAIDVAPVVTQTALTLSTFARSLSRAEAQALLNQTYPKYEPPAIALSMPLSAERAAFVSLAYNRGVSRASGMTEFAAAVTGSDRAEAWYQLRYNAQGTTATAFRDGVAKRRFVEAQTFGLYSNPALPTEVEAKQILGMLTKHRTDILKYESQFGVPPDGTSAIRNMIAVANEDANLLAITTTQTLFDILIPARETFIAWVNSLLPADRQINPSVLNPAAMYYNGNITPGAIGILDATADDGKGVGLEHNVMVGNSGADILIGGKGDDVLVGMAGSDVLEGGEGVDDLFGGADNDIIYGGKGDDTLMGGAGDDLYIWSTGDGNDTIVDPDGGRLIVNGAGYSFGGGTMTKDAAPNTWKDLSGNVKLTHNSAWRLELGDGSTIQLGEDFDPAKWHIKLSDPSIPGATGPINIYLTNPIDPGTVHFNTNVVADIQINDVMSYTDLNPVDHWVWAKYDGGQTITLGDGNDYVDVGRYVGGPNGESWTAVPGEDEDVVSTGGGNDTIRTGYGSDTVSAGAGNDTIYSARVEVGQYHGAADALSGDVVDAGDGNDEVWGSMGADVLFVGTGSENTNSIADYSISTKATRQFDVEFKEFEDRRGRRADAPVLVARRPLTITTDARVKCSNAKTACARSIGHASQGKKV